MFRSDDRGDTWQACEKLWQLPSTRQWSGPVPPYISRLKDLAVSDDDPDLVFGAIEEGWVVRSDDAGRSWQTLSVGLPRPMAAIPRAIAINPASPDYSPGLDMS